MKVTISKSTYTNVEKTADKQVFEDVIDVFWADERYVVVKQETGQTVIPHSEIGRIIIENTHKREKIPHI